MCGMPIERGAEMQDAEEGDEDEREERDGKSVRAREERERERERARKAPRIVSRRGGEWEEERDDVRSGVRIQRGGG